MSKFSLTNILFFQIIWFVSAIYQQSGLAIIGILIIVHFIFSPSKKDDIKVLCLALIGVCVDQLLFMINVIGFSDNSTIIPYWLILLWCYFSLCFNHSLQWIVKLPLFIQSFLGGLFGTLSYIAALSFGAISTTLTHSTFIIYLLIIWSILFPLLSFAHKCLFPLPSDYKKD